MKNITLLILVYFTQNALCQNLENFDIKNLKGDILKITEKTSSPDKKNDTVENVKYITKFVMFFDTKKKLINYSKFYYEDNFQWEVKQTYENSNIQDIQIRFKNMEWKNRAKYFYDSNKRLIRSTIEGNEYNYIYTGAKISEKISFPDGSLSSRRVHLINNLNNKTESTFYSYDNKIILKCTYVYNKLNQEIETNYFYPSGEFKNKVYKKYDKYGNLIESNPFYSDAVILKNMYTYDKCGNWIKRIEMHDGKSNEITERIIEYRDFDCN